MVQINGKYQLLTNENMVEYLVALGIPQEKAEKANSMKPIIEVVIAGNKLSIKSDSGVDNASSEFELGKEVEEQMPLGITLKSTAKVEGDKIIIESIAPKGTKGTRTYVFTDKDAVLTLKTSDSKVPTAKRTYKRL